MKRCCKNVDVTNRELISEAVWTCLQDKMTRSDVLKVNIMAKRTISRRAKRAKPKDNKIYFSKEWQNGSNEIYRKAEKSDNLRD